MATHVASIERPFPAVYLQKLVQWVPSRSAVSFAGKLYLTHCAYARMQAANDRRNPLRIKAGATFDQFVEQGASVHRLFDDTWGRLGVAQLKIMAPKPGVRLIGAFVDPLLFVGLRLYWRDELDFRATKQKGRISYRELGEQAVAEWDALLPDIRRKPMKEFRDV